MEMKTVTDAEITLAVGLSARAELRNTIGPIPKLINTQVRQPVLYGTPTYIRRDARGCCVASVTQSYLRCMESSPFSKPHKRRRARGATLAACE